MRLVNITPQSKGEEEEEEGVLSRYSSGVHKVLDDGCSLTSAITPRLYFNYTETAAMKSKNNMQRRRREGGRERESRKQKAKSEKRRTGPKLGYNPEGIVLIPNTNITTRVYSVHKFQ